MPVTGLPSTYQGDIGSDPGNASVGDADVDMYRVIAPGDGTFVVTVNSLAYGNQAAQTFLRAFNAQGQEIATTAAGSFGRIQLHLTIGETAYIAVSDATNGAYDPYNPIGRTASGSLGKYDLSMSFENGDADGTTARALPLGPGSSLAAYVGTDLNGVGPYTVGHNGSKDVDWYFFQANQTGFADLRATGQDFIPAMSLWQFDSNLLTAVKMAESVQANAELIFPIEIGRSYYIAVAGQGNRGFRWDADATGTGGQTGAYTITYDNLTTPPGGGGHPGLPNLGDLAIGTPTSGSLGMHGSQIVGAAGFDLYSLSLPATGSSRSAPTLPPRTAATRSFASSTPPATSWPTTTMQCEHDGQPARRASAGRPDLLHWRSGPAPTRSYTP